MSFEGLFFISPSSLWLSISISSLLSDMLQVNGFTSRQRFIMHNYERQTDTRCERSKTKSVETKLISCATTVTYKSVTYEFSQYRCSFNSSLHVFQRNKQLHSNSRTDSNTSRPTTALLSRVLTRHWWTPSYLVTQQEAFPLDQLGAISLRTPYLN